MTTNPDPQASAPESLHRPWTVRLRSEFSSLIKDLWAWTLAIMQSPEESMPRLPHEGPGQHDPASRY